MRVSGEIFFVDKKTDNVKKNIEMLGISSGVVIKSEDVLSFIKKNLEVKFDLIFADPPYSYNNYEELIQSVMNFKCLFILEHEYKKILPERFSEYIDTEKKLGISKFTIFNFSK